MARKSTYVCALICMYPSFVLKIKILTIMLKFTIPFLSPLKMEMQ